MSKLYTKKLELANYIYDNVVILMNGGSVSDIKDEFKPSFINVSIKGNNDRSFLIYSGRLFESQEHLNQHNFTKSKDRTHMNLALTNQSLAQLQQLKLLL